MDNFYIYHEDTEGGRDYITRLMSMLWKLRLQLRSLAQRLRPLPPGLGASNSEVRLLFILEEISHVRLGKKKKKHASNISTSCNEFNCSCFVAKSCLLQPYGLSPPGFSVHWISQEICWSGYHCLPLGILPIQGWDLCLLLGGPILYLWATREVPWVQL